jgi:hypothetical protein
MGKFRSRFAASVIAAILTFFFAAEVMAQTAPAPQAQASAATSATQVPQGESGVNWPGAGYGAAALFGNLLYLPAKLVYAVLGGIVGGGTWLVTAGNTQAADTVWRSALGGDYVLTPQMIAGEQPINFSGPTEIPPPPPAETADASAAAAPAGGVQPITPIPAPSAAASTSTSYSSGMHPLDSGSGPVNSKSASAMSGSNIE